MPTESGGAAPGPASAGLSTPHRQREAARIVLVGVLTLLYWRGLLPLQVLLAAVAIGLYPLVKTGVLDLVREHKLGTEIFVTVATPAVSAAPPALPSKRRTRKIHELR